MSERGEAQEKKHALVSGAKPRPEGRVRERGRRPTLEAAHTDRVEEAARPRAIEAADRESLEPLWMRCGGRE
jgi:hypothetical protein